MDFQTWFKTQKVVILDGAMGTELQRRGVNIGLPLWSANALIEHPEMVRQIHTEYLRAGADIITTDTFRTHQRTFEKKGYGKLAIELTQRAVQMAKMAKLDSGRTHAWIAGSLSPLEDCYSPDLSPDYKTALPEHRLQAKRLADAGVDLILIETMNKIEEARAALCAARETSLPVWCSFVCDEDGNLLSGETFPDAVRAIQPLEPDAILVNCTSLAGTNKVMNFFIQDSSIKYYGTYANICRITPEGNVILSDDVSPADYLTHARQWVSSGAKIVGGCCGTMPEHIGALRKLKKEKFEYRKPKS